MLATLLATLAGYGLSGSTLASLVGIGSYAAVRRRPPGWAAGLIISLVVSIVLPVGELYRQTYNGQVVAQQHLLEDFTKSCLQQSYGSPEFVGHCMRTETSLLAWPSVAAAGILLEKGFTTLSVPTLIWQVLWYGLLFSAAIALYGMYYKRAAASRCAATHASYTRALEDAACAYKTPAAGA